MRIVQVNTVCGKGSTGRIAVELSKKMTEHGFENYILYGSGRSDYPFSKKISSDLYVKCNVLKTRIFGKHGFYSHAATWKLLRQLRKIKPDIVHLHNIHGHYINVRMLFAYLKNNSIPVVWTLHDCWPMTGHCSHFDYIRCEKWKTGCGGCPQLKSYPNSWLFDRSKTLYKWKKQIFCSVQSMTLVTPSQWLADIVRQSYLQAYPLRVIHNGINLSEFKPRENRWKAEFGIEGKFLIIGIGYTFNDRKGCRFFLELSKRISADCQIILVGFPQKQKINENLLVLPKTEDVKQLAELYSAADVFVNPTLEDNYPTVNLEAQACGTPVITFDTGGCRETVGKETGIIVPKGDADALYEAVREIKRTGKAQYSQKCIDYAQKHCNAGTAYEAYIKLYQEINIEE